MKVIVKESLGAGYTANIISSCNDAGVQAIADYNADEILFYDPVNRLFARQSDIIKNMDIEIFDMFRDRKKKEDDGKVGLELRKDVMKPTEGEDFKKFAAEWDALQRQESPDIIKTKNCSVIRFGADESKTGDVVERFKRRWRKLGAGVGGGSRSGLSKKDKDHLDHLKDYHDDFGDRVNGIEAQVSEGLDDPRDWSASEGEVEIMWDTDDYEDFGIFRGDGSTYVIDYDRADTHNQLVNEVCRMIGKEYPDLDFEPDDFIIVNEDEFWEQRGGNPGKLDDDDMYLENGAGGDVVDVKLIFTHSHYGKNLEPGDERTIKVDLSKIPEVYDEDDLMSWLADIATKQLPGGGSFTKYDFEIADLDSLIKAVKGDEGFGPDVDVDLDNFGPDSIPDNLSYADALKYYRKLREASNSMNYASYKEIQKKLIDSVVEGLLKKNSIEELADKWFIDYGTANGWDWKTSFRYSIAYALHEIHKKKHPEEHEELPQREHWRGWHEDNCSCGFCSSRDSSD